MDSTQSLGPFSLQMENKNIILTPSPSTETCSSSVMNSTRELFQDFSLYPSNYTQHNNNPVDQGSTLTPNHTDYACNDVFLQLSPRSSCSPQTHHAHQFYPNTNNNKKKATGSNKKKSQCALCTKSFGRPQELQRHQVCHTGERKFPCTKCKKTFARKDAMLRHYKSHLRDNAKNMARIL
jgi:hypothetical protein